MTLLEESRVGIVGCRFVVVVVRTLGSKMMILVGLTLYGVG